MTAFFSNRLIISLVLFLLAACGSDEFAAIKNRGFFNTEELRTAFNQRCSDFTLAKPKVSFLFVWDNSTGRAHAKLEHKKAINKLITTISGNFDFRILMAPLLGSGHNGTYYLANESVPSGQRPTGSSKINNLYNAADKFQLISPVPGSKEGGVKRSYELLQSNRSFFHSSTGVMIVVLMSEEDDDSWCSNTWECKNSNHTKAIDYKNKYVRKFKDLGKQFETLRFFALVKGGKGKIYSHISEQIQGASSLNTGTSDSYNIDREGISKAFEGINKAIKYTLLKHKYNFWPVAGPGNGPFDPGTITVTKYTENGQKNNIPRCTSGITNNCFFYRPEIYRNQNTRYAPTPGAPYTGHLIELRGPQAKVRYPECLRVKTTAYRDYYGYVPLAAKPVKGSIKLEINGKTIHESASNGWQLITDSTGKPVYKDRQNIKIQQDQNGNPLYRNGTKVLNSQSPLYKSGYFLELFGNAIYTNGSSVRFKFDPSAS